MPVSRGLRRPHIPSLKAGRGFHPPVTTIRAVPCRQPRPRLDCGPIRREPAISGLDGSFATRPRSGQRIAHQNACGLPRAFRPASTCPGLARPLSGHLPGTSGGLAPRLSPRGLQACCFRYAFTGEPLRLAPERYSPARVSRRNWRLWSSPLGTPVAGCSFEENLPFQATNVYNHAVSRTFHASHEGLFTFPSQY